MYRDGTDIPDMLPPNFVRGLKGIKVIANGMIVEGSEEDLLYTLLMLPCLRLEKRHEEEK